MPSKLPAMVIVVNTIIKPQFNPGVVNSEPKPTVVFKAMMSKEVPMARRIDAPARILNAGTTINPPPEPTNPVKIPVKKPMNRNGTIL